MPTPRLGKGLGRHQDLPDPKDLRWQFEVIFSDPKVAVPAPTSIDVFSGLDLPVYDQGEIGSCTANAAVLYRRFLAQRFAAYSSKDQDLSRLFLYYQERLLDGTQGGDAGSTIRSSFKVLAKVGVCPNFLDPYNESKFADASLNNSSLELSSAKDYRIGAYHRINSVADAKSCLVSGYPISLGFNVYESFERIGPDGHMSVPSSNESLIGGHAVVIHGYDDGKEAFLVQNSWGHDWGDHGQFWMPYAFLQNAALSNFDMWMGHLGKPWRP